ncbi:leucyl/phenylalanyl-tRNA--protein transferase [Parahaliea mediterranea]|uniref:Leucyl/phenylalanyl-tRNA--protein transferase n=1 Tax=Parahaliea mediterranea TaxID=651086 RepID=A0A939DGB6_9GAMM|nr:leucyl/phenylalanyl-tRNA--protein transferase [Parahaliea mediterranea]MBN7797544.1 leucyl/phenylalanyl-tRNA--protein transferase [Parahaliea mediterranea]
MPLLQRLSGGDGFPPTSEALDYPNGLLAVGGDLSPRRLEAAYRRGIFPWYQAPEPVLWWSPDPRSVLYPEELHVSRSLRKTLRRDRFTLAADRRFREVMAACGDSRRDGEGTWIDGAMVEAYCELHRRGRAHSIEVYGDTGELVGGLYGIALGRVFFGESMFSRVTDASKVALVALVWVLRRAGFRLIDCQVESEHLNSLGARNIARLDFERELDQTVAIEAEGMDWRPPARCGGLL